MTNIKDILAKYGVSIPEDKFAEFENDLRANYKTVNEVSKIENARDNYKTQLETAQNTLKEFEGVDIDELKKKIETLTADLDKKEIEFKSKLADMEFDSWFDGQLTSVKAKNHKAVKALFDIDALKASKSRDADFASQLESVKTESGYLFDDGQQPQITVPGNPASTPSSDAAYMDAFYQNNPFYSKN